VTPNRPIKPRPTISVVIPTYNSGSHIDDALSSIWAQTLLPDEVIVVDDHSSDGTAARVEALVEQSPVPLRVIRRESNSGFPARPMNDGVAAATGELIAVLDHDDVWLPEKLERESRALQTRPEASLVFSLHGTLGEPQAGRWKRRRKSGQLKRRMSASDQVYVCEGSVALDLFVKLENFVIGFPGFMFRKGHWQDKGGFDESIKIATDYEFLCWLCGRGDVVFVPQVHFLRREHSSNLTARDLPRLLDVVRVLLRYIPPAQLADTLDYRRALAGKLFALAKYFTRAGRWREARQLLDVVGDCDLRGASIAWNRFVLPVRFFGRRLLRASPDPRVPGVSEAEAAGGVLKLTHWLSDYGLPARAPR
jgi:glycosyltransferase involved in cell wall biosynthesis